jgi:hypothetical protein
MMTQLASQRGASFIELVTAVSLFALTAVGLSPALLSTKKMAAVSKNRSTATALAIDKIEQLRAGATQSGSDTQGIFSSSWSTLATNYQGIPYVNEVQVQITWPDRPATQTLNMVTLIAPLS